MKKILYKILLAANIFFAFALLMSYLAAHIDPGRFVLPAFFGLAYPYILLVNFLFALLWIVLLKFEALISVVVIILGITHFSNYIKINKPEGNKSDTFKVISYNLRLFNYFEDKNDNVSEEKVLQFLKAQAPDIVCLQEFYVIGDPSEKEKTIRTSLGEGYSTHMKILGSGNNRYYGIATLSRYKIISKGEIIHPSSSSLSIYTDILIQQDTFRIYNNHLQSFRLKRMERSFLEQITVSEESLAVGEIKKLSVSLKRGFKQRASQSEVLKEHITNSPYPVIVAGDFNDTPVSYSYRKIRKGLNDSFVNSGYGTGFTYKGSYPPNRIDYILYDKTLNNSYFEIIKVRYSDHYPIAAYFRIN